MICYGKLGRLISDIDRLAWNLWVYSESYSSLSAETQCLVIDVDNAELGPDGFTPLEVEGVGFQELISMQDLKEIIKNHEGEMAIKAVENFVKNDAFLR